VRNSARILILAFVVIAIIMAVIAAIMVVIIAIMVTVMIVAVIYRAEQSTVLAMALGDFKSRL